MLLRCINSMRGWVDGTEVRGGEEEEGGRNLNTRVQIIYEKYLLYIPHL